MPALTELELLALWERGRAAEPLARADVLLGAALPALDAAARERLLIGEREAALLELHARSFGSRLAGFIACPACASPLEVSVEIDDLRAAARDAGPATGNVQAEGVSIGWRALTCGDLRALAETSTDGEAGLLGCCVTAAYDAAGDVPLEHLPAAAVSAVASALAAADPLAEILLRASCPECGHPWSATVETASFLWSEVAARAHQLLEEIAVLAGTYSWSEREILAMSPVRRRAYLELAA